MYLYNKNSLNYNRQIHKYLTSLTKLIVIILSYVHCYIKYNYNNQFNTSLRQ